jgi:hypothetical protein
MSQKQGNMAANTLKLKKFDMKNIPEDAVCIFIGRRRTGKSTLVRDLLFHHQRIPVGTVISGTEESNSFYSSIVPPLFIHGEYNPVIIDKYVKRQKLVTSRIQQQNSGGAVDARGHRTITNTSIDPRSFLILDDCLYDDSWIHDKNIRYLFLNGRHQKVFFLITMQYPLGIPPMLRTNVDYAFIMREPYVTNRKRIFENFGSAFPSFEFFCQIMDQCTQNYECLVISNNTQSNKLEDIVFWYKASLHGEFRIGDPRFWQHNATYYRDKEEEDINLYDPTRQTSTRKGPVIEVRKLE